MKIKNQKHVEVLVASTLPATWGIIVKNNIATQYRNSADADYIAFLRIHLKDRILGDSAITHIAKVKSCNNNASIKEYLTKYPEALKYSEENNKGWEHHEFHKEYFLEKIEKLPNHPILCRKGEGKRCQVKLYTTLEELNKAEYLGDIKTVAQLEQGI